MASNNYNVLFDAKLNIKNAQAEINQFIAKNNKLAKIDIKISDNITQQFKTATKSVDEFVGKISTIDKTTNTINTSFEKFTNQTNKWVDSQGKLNTVLASTSESGKRMTTWIKEYTDETGNLVKETSQYNNLSGRWQKVNQENVVTTKEAADAQAKLAKELNETSQASNQTANSIDNASKATQSLGERLVTAAGKVALFKVSTTIVMAFYNAIGDAKQAILDYDRAMVEFNKVTPLSNSEIEKMLNNFDELSVKVGRTKTELVEIATEMSKSGFGTSEQEVTKMAELVSLYQNTADEQLSAADASAVLISQMKAFGYTAEDAIHVLDSINKVSAEFAVSSGDIGRGLTAASAALQTYGNNYDSVVGMITGATEIFQNQSQRVARGLNMIASRVAANGDTLKQYGVDIYDVNGSLRSTYDILKDLKPVWDKLDSSQKVSLGTTLSGVNQYKIFAAEMSNFDQVIKATEASLNSQGSTEKQNTEYTKGLEYAISQLKSQWLKFVLGEGGLQNTAKLLINIGTAVLKLINDLGGLKTVLIAITGIIATIKADSILSTIKAFPMLISNIVTSLKGFINAFRNARAEGMAFGTATESALNSVGVAATTAQLAFGALAIAITAATIAVSYFKRKQEELKQKALESTETFKQNIEALNETKKVLNDETASREDLSNALNKTLDGYDAEGKSLDELNSKRQEAIDKINEQIKAEAEQWQRENSSQAIKARQNLTKNLSLNDLDTPWSEGLVDTPFAVGAGAKAANQVQIWVNEGQSLYELYNTLETTIDSLNSKEEELTNSELKQLGVYQESYNYVANSISENEKLAEAYLYYDYVLKGTTESLKAYNDFCAESVNYQNDVIDSTDSLDDTFEDIKNQFGYTKDELVAFRAENEELLGDLDNSSESWYDVAQAMLEAGTQAEDANDSLQNLSSDIKTLAEDYESLQSAVDDYNNGNGVSLESFDALIKAATEYSGCLDFQNGKLVLSEQYFEQLAEQKIANAKADLVMETQARLAALAQQEEGEAAQVTSGIINSATASVDDICVSLQNMANDSITAAQAWSVLANTMNGSDLYSNHKEGYNQIYKDFKAQWNALDELGKGITKNLAGYSKASGGASKSAAGSSKDAWIEAYKAEKETIDAMYENGTYSAEQYQEKLLELQAKYLTDTVEHQQKYASEIKKLYEDIYKALKKAAKEALDDEVDRRKKQLDNLKDEAKKAKELQKRQHEEEEKGIKKRIDLLKREKDSVKESYNEKIDALKREREEYENQVKLMQLKEKLAKAKVTYQYIMDEKGRFNWLADQQAVDAAQEDLYEEELKQAYERQLKDLEDARDAAEKLYDQQIQDLEDYYDEVKERNDKAEQDLEDHYNELEAQYERSYNDFKDYASKVLERQIQATNDENTEWGRRLNNLAEFVNNYNAMLAQLGNAGASVSNNYKGSSSSSVGGGGGGGSTSNGRGGNKAVNAANASLAVSATKRNAVSAVKSVINKVASVVKSVFGKHAKGVAKIDTDEMALVGDSPNQEIAIGSKLNGVPLNLSAGSGVVNAKSTKTLAGLLNSLPNLSPNYSTTNNSNSQSIHIDNINLPRVTNGEEFINYLENFDINMIQNSYSSI